MDVATDTKRVFLVDDHPIVRRGYSAIIRREEEYSIAGEAGSGREALEKISSSEPDLVIVDIAMEGMDGIELTHRLQEERPELPVLIVSMFNEGEYVRQSLDAGARGYVTKDNVNTLMVEAIERIFDGEVYLCAAVKDKVSR